jgi:molecular chaperone DnaK (HSP70)
MLLSDFKFKGLEKSVPVVLEDGTQSENNDAEDGIKDVVLRVEEIAAMILRYAKTLAEKQGSIQIKDCVITVPSHWRMNARLALATAAKISGLHVLSFVHENTAAALYYGIDRVDENKTHTVLFYNLGAQSLQVSVVEYAAVNSTLKS